MPEFGNTFIHGSSPGQGPLVHLLGPNTQIPSFHLYFFVAWNSWNIIIVSLIVSIIASIIIVGCLKFTIYIAVSLPEVQSVQQY
jgi:hypothetical protein